MKQLVTTCKAFLKDALFESGQLSFMLQSAGAVAVAVADLFQLWFKYFFFKYGCLICCIIIIITKSIIHGGAAIANILISVYLFMFFWPSIHSASKKSLRYQTGQH